MPNINVSGNIVDSVTKKRKYNMHWNIFIVKVFKVKVKNLVEINHIYVCTCTFSWYKFTFLE